MWEMKRKLRAVAAVVGAALMLSASSFTASAGSGGAGSSPTAELVREDSVDGNSSTMQVIPSPSGCMGQSNNPHRSTSEGGIIKGFSFTRCDQAVPLVEVRAEVWKKRWWGYQHVGRDGYAFNRNDSYEANSARYSPCEANTWRTVGQHHVFDHDRRDYFSETMKYAGVRC